MPPAYPIRLAGTCRTYSKKAIPQLTRMASAMVRPSRNFSRGWRYQAQSMKKLEATSRTVVLRRVITVVRVGCELELGRLPSAKCRVQSSRFQVQGSPLMAPSRYRSAVQFVVGLAILAAPRLLPAQSAFKLQLGGRWVEGTPL